jgi:predicted ester cyclase
MLAPAQSMQVAFPRIWLKGDVAVVEAVFRATHPASSGIHDVGEDAVFVLEFDRAGKIARELDYQENATLAAQAVGEDGAPAIPALPTTREVHIGGDSPRDASLIAWANDVEARESKSLTDALSVMDEHVAWDCALGFHGTSRDEFAKPLAHWFAAFPDMRFTATRVWPVEDYVIVDELFEGTQDGEFAGIAPTHKRVTWHWLEIWQHRDGKIVHGWSWANFEELEKQLQGPVEHKVKHACALES